MAFSGYHSSWSTEDDEPEHLIDFTFDGYTQLGPLTPKKVRRSVTELRALGEDVLNGGDLDPLQIRLETLYGALERAIKQCDAEARKRPSHAGYFAANAAAYQAAMGGLSFMYDSVENGDAEGMVQGLADFEDAVAEIDKLVAKD